VYHNPTNEQLEKMTKSLGLAKSLNGLSEEARENPIFFKVVTSKMENKLRVEIKKSLRQQ
jgi:hypothetical protein